MFLAMFEKYQNIVLTMQISDVFHITLCFFLTMQCFGDVFEKPSTSMFLTMFAKHRAYDASDDVNRPLLGGASSLKQNLKKKNAIVYLNFLI